MLQFDTRVRVYRTKSFVRFARREGVSDERLCEVVRHVHSTGPDADLGGGVLKLRFARPGRGKSGGYRFVLLFRKRGWVVFVHGYAKNEKANISSVELRAFRELADLFQGFSEVQMELACRNGTLKELTCDHQEVHESSASFRS